MRIVVYNKIVKLNGVYTHDLNFIKTFGKDYEITYVYEAGDTPLLNKIAEHAKLLQNKGQVIETDLCIYSSLYQGAHQIKARKFIQMLHADLKAWKVNYKPVHIDYHVAVGQGVADSFKEHNGMDSVVIPNMLAEDVKVEKVLRLVTASRIAEGKGFDRTTVLARKLQEAGRPFIWEIYGGGAPNYINNLRYNLTYIPEVVLMGERTGIQSFMACSDYVVQLSDNEGYCYSIHEALQIGKPVIATRWPGIEEVVKDGENGYILDMDLGNLDINKLYDSIPKGGRLKVSNSVLLWKDLLNNI